MANAPPPLPVACSAEDKQAFNDRFAWMGSKPDGEANWFSVENTRAHLMIANKSWAPEAAHSRLYAALNQRNHSS